MADQEHTNGNGHHNGHGHNRNGNGNGYRNSSSSNGSKSPFIFETSERNLKQGNDDEIDLKKLLFSVWRNKWVLTAFLAAGLLGAYIYVTTVTPVYQSEGTIMITSTDNSISKDSDLSKIIAQSYGVGLGSNLSNELEILQSRMLATEMAEKIRAEKTDAAGWFPLLWVEDEDDESLFGADTVRAEVPQIAEKIRDNISFAQNKREADLVTVSYQSPSPEEAAYVVNVALETYSELSTSQNRMAAESAVTFLDEEQQELEKKLKETEQELRAFMNRSGIVQVDAQATRMIDQLATIESELQKTKVNLQVLESGITNHRQRIDAIRPGLSRQFSDAITPKISSYQQKLAELETERMLLISNNPGILERDVVPPRLQQIEKEIDLLRNEIISLTERLFTEDDRYLGFLTQTDNQSSEISDLYVKVIEMEAQKSQEEARRLILLEERKKIGAQFESLPNNMIDLARLQRDVKINEELFLTVSKQNAEMSLLRQTQFGIGRIIDTGYVPDIPVSPKVILVFLIGFLLGGIGGVLFVLGYENLGNKIKSIEQLKSRKQPLLSSVPVLSSMKEKSRLFRVSSGTVPELLFTKTHGTSLEAESIRRLKNNIIYMNPDVRPKSLVITSPEKGDGKTTIASNLAVVYAEAGYKTIVIDTDFRRPKLHRYFGYHRSPGLSDFLFGDLRVSEMLRSTDIPNLNVVTAGKETPHPEALTESQAFRKLLAGLESKADMIIFDTSPFGIISDATALLNMADATLVVAKFKKTNTAALDQTLEILNRIHANVIGTVLNGFDHKKESGYYYNSGYYKSVYENYTSYMK